MNLIWNITFTCLLIVVQWISLYFNCHCHGFSWDNKKMRMEMMAEWDEEIVAEVEGKWYMNMWFTIIVTTRWYYNPLTIQLNWLSSVTIKWQLFFHLLFFDYLGKFNLITWWYLNCWLSWMIYPELLFSIVETFSFQVL